MRKKVPEADGEAPEEKLEAKAEAPEERPAAKAEALEEKKALEAEGEAPEAEAAAETQGKAFKAVRMKPWSLSDAQEVAVQLCIENWSEMGLRPELRNKCVKVRERGLGVCSTCKYTYGCKNCHGQKAWQ